MWDPEKFKHRTRDVSRVGDRVEEVSFATTLVYVSCVFSTCVHLLEKDSRGRSDFRVVTGRGRRLLMSNAELENTRRPFVFVLVVVADTTLSKTTPLRVPLPRLRRIFQSLPKDLLPTLHSPLPLKGFICSSRVTPVLTLSHLQGPTSCTSGLVLPLCLGHIPLRPFSTR